MCVDDEGKGEICHLFPISNQVVEQYTIKAMISKKHTQGIWRNCKKTAAAQIQENVKDQRTDNKRDRGWSTTEEKTSTRDLSKRNFRPRHSSLGWCENLIWLAGRWKLFACCRKAIIGLQYPGGVATLPGIGQVVKGKRAAGSMNKQILSEVWSEMVLGLFTNLFRLLMSMEMATVQWRSWEAGEFCYKSNLIVFCPKDRQNSRELIFDLQLMAWERLQWWKPICEPWKEVCVFFFRLIFDPNHFGY